MQIGTKLVAPEGYLNLAADEDFYFLVNCTRTGRALLATIKRGKREWDAHLVALRQQDFERGILSGKIVEEEDQPTVPPHLEGLEGIDLRAVDGERIHAKKSNIWRAQERVLAIVDYVDAWPEIVAAANPERYLNQMIKVREQTPRRIRFWLVSYLCFGRSELALYPAFARIGHYDRTDRTGCMAYGRPNGQPDLVTASRLTKEDVALIEKSFVNLARETRDLTSIYPHAMVKFFHAQTDLAADGNRRYISPTGAVLPTYRQYVTTVENLITRDKVREAKLGKNLARRKTRNKGSFREPLTNFMEVVECDGYFPREKPRSYVSQKELDPLCIVRAVCATTSQIVGIGFSLRGEHSIAYWTMIFSMAIDKKKFCSLFGIEIAESEWLGHGLPLRAISDRGAGATLYDRIELPGRKRRTHRLPIRELTPSGSGQSKALVEGKHPKTLKLEEPNTYVKSDKTVSELVASEIFRCIAQNETQLRDTGYTATLSRRNVRPTPASLTADLIKVGRTSAQPLSFDEAVRCFLPKETISLTRDGAKFRGIIFRSTSLSQEIPATQGKRVRKIKAHYLPLSLRHIWVEIGAKLLQLDNENISNAGEEDVNLSEFEASELEQRKKRNRRRQETNRFATGSQRILNEQSHSGRPFKEPELTTRQSERTPKASARERAAHVSVLQGDR